MEPWVPDARYSWGAFPLGPVANSVGAQDFLWERGQRSGSNYPLDEPGAGSLGGALDRDFHRGLPLVPQACLPLQGGCFAPPLSRCRSSIKQP
jgi:hypothetical protein